MRTLTFRQRRLLRKVDQQLRASTEATADSADGELNIVPFLDVVVNLIMFLLMTVTATLALAQVPASLSNSRPGARPAVRPAPPPLVHLAADGIHVFARERRMAPGCTATGDGTVTVPRVGGAQDWLGLRSCAFVLSQEEAAGTRVDLSAAPDAPYDDVIRAMDALRGPAGAPLFSDVRWVAPRTAR